MAYCEHDHYHEVEKQFDSIKFLAQLTLEWVDIGLDYAMCNSLDHFIKLYFAVSQESTLGGVIEATGLFVNAFVEGDVLHDRTYEYSIECVAPKDFVIRAKLRHPLEEGRFAQERAIAPLYVVFAAWFLAGANVEIEGPWEDSFPGRGTLEHETKIPLLLRPIFQDEMPISERAVYPSLETLAEIHNALTHRADWNHVKENPAFRNCFPTVSPNPRATNNIRLCHRSGLNMDLVLEQAAISSHIVECIQAEIDTKFISCERKTLHARTWWDAWIGHCPSTCITPKQLLVLPDEVAILSVSGSIWRYQLQNTTTLERHLEIDFGDGVDPTRPIESWLQLANQFGEAGFVEVAIACCEQAIASATAMISNAPGSAIKPPIGLSPQQQLNESETEYLRWLDYKESLENPQVPHDRWNDKVDCGGVHELTIRIGSQWAAALQELIEAINNEHCDSHDYRRKIGHVPQFFWNIDGEIGTLKYSRLFGRKLMDAKVSRKALSMLGHEFREEVIPSYVDFVDIFTLALGKTDFWGSVEQRVLISCSEPNEAYFL